MGGPFEVSLIAAATSNIGTAKMSKTRNAPTRSMMPLMSYAQETSGVERKTSIGRPAKASKSGFAIEV